MTNFSLSEIGHISDTSLYSFSEFESRFVK